MDGEIIKLIVECEMCEATEEVIREICRVKHCLPDLGCYVVEVNKADYSRVAALDGVKAVHATAKIAAQSHSSPENVKNSADIAKSLDGFTGEGVTIAFLDTGISPVKDFLEPINRIAAFKDFINGREEAYDDNCHGTHVRCRQP